MFLDILFLLLNILEILFIKALLVILKFKFLNLFLFLSL